MAPLTAKICSFSSEDTLNKAENILSTSNSKWLCGKLDVGTELILTLKLDVPSKISHINIGNHGCASVDIKVGKSTWHEGRPYEILLPNTTLMSPAECKDWVHISRVFMFGQTAFCGHIAQRSWDYVRISCRQPFDKKKQFGLEFLDLRGVKEEGNQQETDMSNMNLEDRSTKELTATIKRAVSSSGGSTPGRPPLSRSQQCLENALARTKKYHEKPLSDAHLDKGPFDHDRKSSYRALKQQREASKKFKMEVECFLNGMNITKMNLEMTKVSDLRHHIEEIRGMLLNREERKAFFQIVGRKINRMIFPEALDGSPVSFHGNHPSSNEQSTPSKKMTVEERKRMDNIRMKRRSTGLAKNDVFYGVGAFDPPKKSCKEDSITVDMERNTSMHMHQDIGDDFYSAPKRNCQLCGKAMSEVTLKVHLSFCQGKNEFEKDCQEVQHDLSFMKRGQQRNALKIKETMITSPSDSSSLSDISTATIDKISSPLTLFYSKDIDDPLATEHARELSSSADHKASCPICYEKFPITYINSHVNNCLDFRSMSSYTLVQ